MHSSYPAAVWGEEGGRGCEGLADVFQQQQLPPRLLLSHRCTCCCGERGCEGVADVFQQQQLPPHLLLSHGCTCCCGRRVKGWRMCFSSSKCRHASSSLTAAPAAVGGGILTPGTAPAEALHTFTLDSGASRCLFRDSTTLTPLPAPVPVRLADPSGGPVVAHSSTVLPCPAVTSGSLLSLHLPSFSTNLVSASGQVAPPCSCRLLSHQTLIWHHRLGQPSLPHFRGMHSRLLVSGLPWSLPPLPHSRAPPCLPCVEGWQRAAPHSSSFPLTTASLQTLHMDVWGPARVTGQGRERYFLLVVDDYMRYTTVFPLRSKGEVPDVLIPWIHAVCLHLRERFGQDLPVLRLHSDRGGEFSSDLLREFCRGEGILQSFTLPASPQQNGIAEHRIGLVKEPCVSLPESLPTLRWTGKVGDASVFRVWGSRAFVRDTSADKLSTCAIPCVFHGFPPNAPGWRFYHPTSRRVLSSQDVTFDESVPFYRLFPYRSAPPPPSPLFLAPDPLPGTVPVEVGGDSGAARGAASRGVGPRGAEPGGAKSYVTRSRGAEPGGAEPEGAEPADVEPRGVEPKGFEPGASAAGDTGVRGVGATRLGGAGATAGAGGTRGTVAASSGGARTRGTGAVGTGSVGGTRVGGAGAGDPAEPGGAGVGGTRSGGTGAGGAGAVGAGARGTSAGGAGAGAVDHVAGGAGAGGGVSGSIGARGTLRPRPYFVPLLQQVLGLTERREPASRPVLPVCTVRRVPHPRPPPVPGIHAITLRPSSFPLSVHLPPSPASSLPAVPDPPSDLALAASPTVSRLLAIVVTDPSFESTAASALVAELLEFAATCRLDYATALVAEYESASPPSVGGECALGTDVLEDTQEELQCFDAALPHLVSTLLAPEGDPDAPDIPTPRSYTEAITGPYSS
ncbi:unnamed protein product [Closterium sp. NIES-53]